MSQDLQRWEKQPSEPNEQFKRFYRYLTLPGKRSLQAAYNLERVERGRKKTTTCPDSWWNAFKAWNWQERAAAWDRHNQIQELEEWKERRRQLRQAQWEDAHLGIAKAKEMLKLPIVRKSSSDGQTTIVPADWTFRQAIAILAECYGLARQASGFSTLTEEEALQVLVDLGVFPPEIVHLGTEVLRQATQSILDAIARTGTNSESN